LLTRSPFVTGHPYSPCELITGDLILKQQTVLTDISGRVRALVLGACLSLLFIFTCAWNEACHFAFALWRMLHLCPDQLWTVSEACFIASIWRST